MPRAPALPLCCLRARAGATCALLFTSVPQQQPAEAIPRTTRSKPVSIPEARLLSTPALALGNRGQANGACTHARTHVYPPPPPTTPHGIRAQNIFSTAFSSDNRFFFSTHFPRCIPLRQPLFFLPFSLHIGIRQGLSETFSARNRRPWICSFAEGASPQLGGQNEKFVLVPFLY
jgi:hypothetical protein